MQRPPVPFQWVDVFGEEPFAGNPLGVLDGAPLPEELLLPLARELALSETTFYYPPTTSEADARVRIFTQAKEVPFAGHPTLGTAVALLLLGRLPWRAPETTVRLELGIGVVPVTVTGERGPERARFRHGRIAVPGGPDGAIQDERLAWLPPALGVDRGQIGALLDDGRTLWPQVVSGGALQLMVPLVSPDAVEQLAASRRDVIAAERALGAELGMLAFAFTGEQGEAAPPGKGSGPAGTAPPGKGSGPAGTAPPGKGSGPAGTLRVRARLFAGDAPLEDPATGSAAAALAVFFHHHGLLAPGQALEIDQGPPFGLTEEIPGRRGLLRAFCDGTTVEVEGRVREVLRGELRLPL